MNCFRAWELRQRFNPSILGALVNPYFLTRRALWKAIRDFSPELGGVILDLGCGDKPYQSIFSYERYIGVDIPEKDPKRIQTADILYDGKRLPFRNLCFDSILCTEVLEHTQSPDAFLREAHRVLKDDGLILLTTPFAWEEHEQPHDYNRFSSFGLRKATINAGFEIVAMVKTLPSIPAIAQLFAATLFRATRSKGVMLGSLTTPLMIFPISILGLLLGLRRPKSDNFYIGNVVLLKKLQSRTTGNEQQSSANQCAP